MQIAAETAELMLRADKVLKQLASGKPPGAPAAPTMPQLVAQIDQRLDEAMKAAAAKPPSAAPAGPAAVPAAAGAPKPPTDPLATLNLDKLKTALDLQGQVMKLEREHAEQMNALEWQRR